MPKVVMFKDNEKAAIAKVASLGVRHKTRADALRIALNKALEVAGLPTDSMDEYVAQTEAELFHGNGVRVQILTKSFPSTPTDTIC